MYEFRQMDKRKKECKEDNQDASGNKHQVWYVHIFCVPHAWKQEHGTIWYCQDKCLQAKYVHITKYLSTSIEDA